MLEEKDEKKVETVVEDLKVDAQPAKEHSESGEKTHFLVSIGMFFLELLKIAILAGITIGLVRYFLFKPFYVEGQSMEPTFEEKEYLIIDEITYRFTDPKRGDVIVLKAPVDHKDYYLKRIIGLPGERIKVENNKVVVYNTENSSGVLVEEKYITQSTPGSVTITLGPDQYFVMGDNRQASYDSRRFGAVHRKDIIGRTWLRGWPINRITLFEPPTYNF